MGSNFDFNVMDASKFMSYILLRQDHRSQLEEASAHNIYISIGA